MKPQHSRDVARTDSDPDPLLERLRRLSLAVAQGDANAARVVVVTAPDALRDFRLAVEEDGGRFFSAVAEKRGDPLAPVRALLKKLAKNRATGGTASLVRIAAAALESSETWTVLALENADAATPETARWWWALARRLSSSEALAPALLVASVGPRQAAQPLSSWRALEDSLAASLRIARVAAPRREMPRGATPPRRAPAPRAGFASIRHVLAERAGAARNPSARLSLLAGALAALRGDAAAVEEHADAAAELAARADAARGDDLAAKLALVAIDARGLARPFRRLLRWLEDEDAPAPAGDRVQAWALLREAGRTGAPAGDPRRTRARALLEATGARATVRAADASHAAGLSATGREDAVAWLAAAAGIAGSSSSASVAATAIDAALSLVPGRGGQVTLSAGGDPLIAVRRGSALVGLPPETRLQAPLKAEGATESCGTLVLERAAADPPFSRDERRVVEALARVAAARILAIESAAPADVVSDEHEADLGSAERAVLERALAANEQNLSRTARALGLSRNGLKMKMARHGLRG